MSVFLFIPVVQADFFSDLCTELLTAAGERRQSLLESNSEEHTTLSKGRHHTPGFEIPPRTSFFNCLATLILPRSSLSGRCEQQHSNRSGDQRLTAWVQMAHPVGVCQTSTVCAHLCSCGEFYQFHYTTVIHWNWNDDVSRFSSPSVQPFWTFKSRWCSGIWSMWLHATSGTIQAII